MNKVIEKIKNKIPSYKKRMIGISIDIGAQIHEYMKSEGINQRELADRLDKKESEISKWLSGSHNFTIETIAKIEEVFGKKIVLVPMFAAQELSHSSVMKVTLNSISWDSIPKTEHKGETGTSFWQTVEYPGLRIRVVEYSKNYKADHWCQKGHIVHCLEGSFVSELESDKVSDKVSDKENEKHSVLSKGNTYVVSDGMSSHRSVSADGAKLLIIDGDFLNL